MEKERPIDSGSSPRSDTFGPAVVGEKNSRSASVDVAEKKEHGGFRKEKVGKVGGCVGALSGGRKKEIYVCTRG